MLNTLKEIREALESARTERFEFLTMHDDEGEPTWDDLYGKILSAKAKLTALIEQWESVMPAYKNLCEHQGQLDEDGIMVSVSRQALDEVLNTIKAITGEAGEVGNAKHS